MHLMGGQRVAFFPKADAAVLASRHAAPASSERPTTTAPILDLENADKPLEPWTAEQVTSVYPSDGDIWTPAPIPAKTLCPPQCSSDRYLFPVLTRNERLRLTLLYYYTRGALEDVELMSRLQEKVHLAHETVGWEFVIAGLLSHSTYTRMVTVNLPLAILPRRESTCAHTINQPPGTVFALQNMAEDWRFEKSPHVEQGGLRAYAGVPLRFDTEFGEHVAFGSLCVASNSPQEPLSPSVQQALARLADWIVTDIVHSARARRQKERRRMLELLSQAQQQCDNHHNMEEVIPRMLEDVYLNTQVSIHQTTDSHITFAGGTRFRTSELEQGLWEDTAYFDYAIENLNHLDMTAPRPVRAIAAQCTSQRAAMFLVVASNDLKMVFDDIDSWFVHMCATILCRYWQGRALQEALSAKETFLRGITHQLRTPIHGILGSVELLTEELKARNVVPSTAASSPTASPDIEQLDPYTYIKTIKTSARELISTVNNLIKLNQWADIAQAERVLTMHTVSEIEDALLKETLLGLSDDLSTRPSIVIQHHLPPSCDLLAIDKRVFLDCIQPLMVNAAQNAAGGMVAVTISIEEGCQSLVVDVEHSGRKTPKGNYDRVFDVHEQIDLSGTESALGLTLASKAATLLGGEIKMVTSPYGAGSHIRATFNEPVCASSFPASRTVKDRFSELPQTFHHLTSKSATSSLGDYFTQYLSSAGWTASNTSKGAFVVVDYTPNLAELYRHTSNIDADQVAICLVPECACFLDFHTERVRRQGNVVYVQGPFLSETFEQALKHADAISAEFRASALEKESRATGGIVIEPVSQASTLDSNERPQLPSERGSIFPDKLQNELVQSVRTLRIETKPPASTKETSTSSKPLTLLVDDNAVNLRLLEMYCSRRGIPFRSAKDGQQAVNIFSEALVPKYDPLLRQNLPIQPFGLILMDLQMPVCDGIDATRQIRRLEKQHGYKRSVLFIVTGQDSSNDRKAADDAGADEFLTKPVGPKVLDQWVKKWYPDIDI
ncbi:uncharacterized protein J4E78_006584 [Alternaria triticimaculans]|uniref:uncharacterized protein n=1 Tax=Alternaria triticimaculans TaxID=297637 RepID=UPI0020C5AD5C|nr:uncharacterized protein J4E78_006584 [Alternaria triticimaculans]KAI4656693.1 hypothetical protein J4E78_006584 [Alternaria triticimaculans]